MTKQARLGFLFVVLTVLGIRMSAQTIVQGLTVSSGQQVVIADPFLIQSQGVVQVKSGGSLLLWTAGRVNLTDGFKAESGASMRTVLDSDYDGYSDEDENKDTDGDGIFDALETRYGLNPNNAADGAQDADGDGMSNRDELLAGRNPFDRLDGIALPNGVQLVLRVPTSPSPSYQGVNTSNWSITTLSTP